MGAKCCYTVDTMRETLHCLTPLFDVVRLVDPTDTAVVTLKEDGSLSREPYTCFHVWNRECRCRNCTSMRAAADNCQRTKYEFIRENVFYVVSQPLTLFVGEERLEVVMEIVSHVSNQLLLEPQEDGKTMLDRLEDALGMTLTMSAGVAELAIGFSMAVGVIFGLYPANKASKLKPIDALHYD